MILSLSFILVVVDVSSAVAGRVCLSLFHLQSTVLEVADLPLTEAVAYFVSSACGQFGRNSDTTESE